MHILPCSIVTSSDIKPNGKRVDVVGVRFTHEESTLLSKLAEKDGRKKAGLLYKLAKEYLEAAEV